MRNYLLGNQKKNLFFSFSTMCLLLLAVVGCKEELNPIPEIRLEENEVTVASEGGEVSFEYSLINPIAEADVQVVCDADWISEIDSSHPDVIEFVVAENKASEGRETTMSIEYPQLAAPVQFTVKQEGHAMLKFEPKSVSVGSEGGQQTVKYTIENPVEGAEIVPICEDMWIKDINVSADRIEFYVAPNYTFTARQTVISVSYPGVEPNPELKIKQEGLPVPEVSLDRTRVEVPGEGGVGELHFSVKNPIEGLTVGLDCKANWVTNMKVEGDVISFVVLKNPEPVARETEVVVSYKGAEHTVSFVIAQSEGALTGNITVNVKGIEFEMIYVKGGSFTMGATEEQGDDARSNEEPAHKVNLSDYYIGKFEVTQDLWEAVMGENPSYNTGNPKRPVDKVSWNMIQEFIAKLNQLSGRQFSLPTEAQWEFAARGGNESKGYKYSGSDNLDEVAWYYLNSENESHEVGQKSPNELGIFDMSGNVYEYCQDCFEDYTADEVTDPKGPKEGSFRVLRGGSYFYDKNNQRVSSRLSGSVDFGYNDYGFRIALQNNEVVEPAPEEPDVTVYTANGVSFEMVTVEGGTFSMGGTPEQGDDSYYDEFPVHKVTLSDYQIGRYEVTQELWEAVMGSNPSDHVGVENLPVEQVSWDAAQEFIKKLNEVTGKTFSLPSEAQWEFAARGGNKSRGYKYSGGNDINEVAWWRDNQYEETTPVGQKAPNELGCYDMSGNVWEWCIDSYVVYPTEDQVDPVVSSDYSLKMLRGGSFKTDYWGCRVAFRHNYGHNIASHAYGLRLVLSL